jgi:hypothetical protein
MDDVANSCCYFFFLKNERVSLFCMLLKSPVGKDGSLYFIPENGYRVMRVTPPLYPPQIIDGKLPEDDVTIELM